jgi:hypothetical protein
MVAEMNVKDLEPLDEGEPVYAPLYTQPLDTGGNIMRGIVIGILLSGPFWGVFFYLLWN